MKGGKRGLLVNSRDLCAKPSFSFMNFKAQNGKQLKKKRLPLRVPACRGKGGKAEAGLIDAGAEWVWPSAGAASGWGRATQGKTRRRTELMSKRAGILSVTSAVAVALMLAVMAPAAGAAFGVSKWEAGTCKSDVPEMHLREPPGPVLHPGRRPPADRPHRLRDERRQWPAADRGAPEGDDQRRPGRPPRGPQRRPSGGSAVPESDLRSEHPRAAPPARSGSAKSPLRCSGSPSARCRSPSTTSTRRRGCRRCSASRSACRESRSPTSTS